ncbi:metallophosphoesterase family protein [Nitratifractor salsuginis]|uniref:Metallophosphoesterase n=1 Tax=Nitratifractor salsuginis (strain DSM 16511 / JCM 12458 / E9I37-1) TaxID=749222 RepID=E6X0N4_NITSE|nr:metallophosphoesterase [Nitratifractor salsuginis]ADV45754.1 metallophosphoesterase [Nitratifractor salsuginis DSM 16511]
MRILHCSDPHFDLSLRSIPWKKLFGKRAIGALNLLGGRGRYFDEAEEKIAALARFKERYGVDLVLCTGDVTALGLTAELENAAELLAPLAQPPKHFIIIPGNHDVYSADVIRGDHFHYYFGQYMHTDWPQYAVDGPWPIVRLFSEDIAVVAVNSAKPNPLPWRSDGYIPPAQLEALEKILQDHRIKDRWIFVMTHYAARLANGRPDKPNHGLRNADEFLNVCRLIQKGAILNGHVHRCYRTSLADEGLNIDEYCAGSVTMEGRECFWLFDVNQDSMKVHQGYFDKEAYEFKLRKS